MDPCEDPHKNLTLLEGPEYRGGRRNRGVIFLISGFNLLALTRPTHSMNQRIMIRLQTLFSSFFPFPHFSFFLPFPSSAGLFIEKFHCLRACYLYTRNLCKRLEEEKGRNFLFGLKFSKKKTTTIDQILMVRARGIGSGGVYNSGNLDHIDAIIPFPWVRQYRSGLGRVLLIGCESEPVYDLGGSNYETRSMWQTVRRSWRLANQERFEMRVASVLREWGSGLMEACELSYFERYDTLSKATAYVRGGKFSSSSRILLGKREFTIESHMIHSNTSHHFNLSRNSTCLID